MPTNRPAAATLPRVVTHWRVVWRRDRNDAWMDWGSWATEDQARGELAKARSEYPHYESELRRVTTRIERVDV